MRRSSIFMAILVALTVAPLSVNAQSTAWQVLIGGDTDTTPHEPSGVAVDPQGSIYVVDTSGSRIERLSAAGRVLATYGHPGTGSDALKRPRGIALDTQGTLYVADTANHRIQRFATADGSPLGSWGEVGTAPGEFILPTSVALDSAGNVFVADTGNHRIQKLGPDGQPVAQWGGLHFPHGLAIDASDTIYVTDASGVHTFSTAGDPLADWTAPGEFGDPYGIGVGPDGTVYVADTDNGRIDAVSPNGAVQARWGSVGHALGQLTYPEAIAVDPNGALYVADRGNNRILILKP